MFFTDYTPDSEIPFRLMGIVKQNIDDLWGQESMGSYLTGEYGSMLVLPEKLDGLPFEEWPKIPGNNSIRGVWPMLASQEYADSVFLLTFGKPESNISPSSRLLMWLKGIGNDEISIHGVAVPTQVQTSDSTTLYRLPFERMPRTASGRPLLRVGRIP